MIDPGMPVEGSPSEESDRFDRERQREVLAKVADAVARRDLAVPVIFILESGKPLSVVASQGLFFLKPLVRFMLGIRDYDVFAAAIEDRENLEWLIQRLEAHEEAKLQQKRAQKKHQPKEANEECQ